MKILLFGEFSGLHANLKYGLEQLGHKVTLVSNGDGSKQIGGADIYLRSNYKNRFLRALSLRWKCLITLPLLRGFDVVQYITPYWLPFPKRMQLWYLKYLKKHNTKVFYNACGDDSLVSLNMLRLRYSPASAAVGAGEYSVFCRQVNHRNVQYTLRAYDTYDGIIASSYTYQLASANYHNYLGYIPFPSIAVHDCIPFPSLDGTVKIFFGCNRPADKGASHILEALRRIEFELINQVQIELVRNVPYAEYVKLFNSCHIFIDQSSSYGYGMNALLAMVKGKVVLGGCEPEMQDLLDRPCPVINILPNAQDIYDKLKELILNKEKLAKIGYENYQFVKDVHEPVTIAQQYVDKWSQVFEHINKH